MNRQQNLFEDAVEVKWQQANREDGAYAGVVFNRPMEQVYHYEIPDGLRELIRPGQRVQVPLGRGDRLTTGFCVRVDRQLPAEMGKSRRLKSVESVLDREPLADSKMLDLTRWIAEHYLCSWGQVLHAVIPAAIKKGAGARDVKLVQIAPQLLSQLDTLPLTSKQKAVIDVLRESQEQLTLGDLAEAAGCGVSPINTLLKKGILEASRESRLQFDPGELRVPREADLALSRQQQSALDALVAAIDLGFRSGKTSGEWKPEQQTFLLHGVTGSGKTEVYIRAIRHAVQYGRQAIVLVPEISLTPQTIRRFRRRFDSVAVLHSHLTDSERHWQWQQIASGKVQVIVGARSAIFAPTPRLGLIVIDEEHETTFK
ncbi:MAG: DEAD/DEAH box helicase, partial [Anaerolineales bacterium]|nr:DEAD/DEAH box helicase [Anaerolineales bacterium]